MAAENFSLRSAFKQFQNLNLREKTVTFSEIRAENGIQALYLREITSPADRVVYVYDHAIKQKKRMLMFGSNNYLGLANHPKMLEKINSLINGFGIGLAGPPLLNGYTTLHKKLEERVSALKRKEATLLFTSGFSANVGLLHALADKRDVVLYDEYSHASFMDGLKMSRAKAVQFSHNDMKSLQNELLRHDEYKNKFIAVEGVYSMDGDTAPLPELVSISKKHNGIIIMDDAHGTGVLGENGGGTCEHYKADLDIVMGTFSKALASTGGFISADKEIIEYIRFFSRSYMFSTSPTPLNIAAVLAALEIMEEEPERITQLASNTRYTVDKLSEFVEFAAKPESAIISVKVPEEINIRTLANQFHESGIFLNAIEYPAVQLSDQRFRISMMASHTREDMDRLIEVFYEIWTQYNIVKSNVMDFS